MALPRTVEPQYVLEDFSGQGHTDDVTCLSRLSSVTGLLATGGDDGYICIWKIQESCQFGPRFSWIAFRFLLGFPWVLGESMVKVMARAYFPFGSFQ